MLNRKLYLPIIEPGFMCACSHEINVYGNHFFQCKKYSKLKASNCIRDGTHFILAEIGI
jgi:hypothetical protein